MVVDDFDIARTFLCPPKADAPLVVDPDRMLPQTIAGQRFKPISRKRTQVGKIARAVKHIELTLRLFFNSTEALHERATPQLPGGSIAKRAYHLSSLLRDV
jgi:hypothetical protein